MKKLIVMILIPCLLLLFACSNDVEKTESDDASVESTESMNSIEAESSEDSSAESSEDSSAESTEDISEESFEDSSVEISEESSEESTEPAEQVFCSGRFDDRESIKLVAFGDSIARGYGLADPATQSYPALLAQSIETLLDGVSVEYANYAVDGMKTSGLLELLKNDSSALDGADIVVVCIGANNILGPFMASLGVNSDSDISGTDPNATDLAAFLDEFNALLQSEQFAADMQAGIATAAKEMPEILKLIKEKAPNAVVAVTTVYSPYHNMVLSVPYLGKSVNMGEASDKWVSLLNVELRKAVADENCLLVESYDAFAATTGLVNARFSLMPPSYSFDPHPSINGHIKLANLYMAELLKY